MRIGVNLAHLLENWETSLFISFHSCSSVETRRLARLFESLLSPSPPCLFFFISCMLRASAVIKCIYHRLRQDLVSCSISDGFCGVRYLLRDCCRSTRDLFNISARALKKRKGTDSFHDLALLHAFQSFRNCIVHFHPLLAKLFGGSTKSRIFSDGRR